MGPSPDFYCHACDVFDTSPHEHGPKPVNPRIPKQCKGCGASLFLENLFVDDGCPCNSPRGCNITPRPCWKCQTSDCVKPGHHLEDLYGMPADAWKDEDDKPLPEDAQIHAAFPTRSGRHDLYGEAMRLVSARYSKGGLVALVNWLLHRTQVAVPNTWIVTRETSARYLGAYEWVRNPSKAAHFITQEAAEAAAAVARESNGNVKVEQYAPDRKEKDDG
jgi:hypothetical protein